MEGNWWETENSMLYRPPLMSVSSYQQPTMMTHYNPQLLLHCPPNNSINPNFYNLNNFTIPTNNFTPPTNNLTTPTTNPNPNPNPNILIAEEERQENSEVKDRSVGSGSANSKLKPRGFKNKAKPPPVVVETESPHTLQSLVLEIPDGCDIIEILTNYARENRCGLVVLCSSGNVKDLAIRNKVASEGFISLPGDHQILSLHGAFFPTPSAPAATTGVTVFVAGELGQVLGGVIAGRLVASRSVKVVAATFSNTTFLMLPSNTPGDTSASATAVFAPTALPVAAPTVAPVAAAVAAPSSGPGDLPQPPRQGPLNPQDYWAASQPAPPSFY